MPKNIAPIVPAESDTAPRTLDELDSTLRTWIDSVLGDIQGAPQYEAVSAALWKYLIRTIRYANDHGVSATIDYHRAVCEAASRTPPQYDPVTDGDSHFQSFLTHLAHRKVFASRRGRTALQRSHSASEASSSRQSPDGPQRGSKRSRGGARDSDRCVLHPLATHTNAACRSQGAAAAVLPPRAGAAPAQ